MTFGQIIIFILCAAVGLVLFRGLWNMMKDGPGNTSQKLMRLRVVAQGVAIIVVVIVVYMSR